MGHEHHFLSRLDRFSFSQVELALRLYRDDRLLRFVLSEASLPAEALRVAISLGDPREGPFLVVTREGRFVTCLGEGMRTGDLPVITREQLDGRMARVAGYRAQGEERRRLSEGGAARKLIKRIASAGDELSCEDFTAISAFQPLLAWKFLELHADFAVGLARTRDSIIRLFKRTEKPRPAMHPLLRAYWDSFWALGHLAVLAAMSGPELLEGLPDLPDKSLMLITKATMLHGIVELALQGVWSAAKLGKGMLPAYKRCYEAAQSDLEVIEAMMVLTALGLRHSRLRAEVRKTLSSLPSRSDAPVRQYSQALLKLVDMAFDEPDKCSAIQRDIGARTLVEHTAGLPPGSPCRFERVEDVPADLAMRAAIHDSGDFLSSGRTVGLMFLYLPWLARASAEQLYLPADVIRARHERWRPEHTHRLVDCWIEAERRERPDRPEGPTRKGPCPCGSGKKYKHCCDGGARRPSTRVEPSLHV